MSKPRTSNDLLYQLDADLSWRRHELSELHSVIKSSDEARANVLTRALIPLLYAHFEGYIRFCILKYFQYLETLGLPYSDLERQIYINSFLKKTKSMFGAGANLISISGHIDEIISSQHNRCTHVDSSLVDARSNLNSNVLKELCYLCSLDYGDFLKHELFLDKFLLSRRNSIAHGEEIYLSSRNVKGESEVKKFIDQTLEMMLLFKASVSSKVAEQKYLCSSK
ncbi:MAE_28990/MAE_18760 family HEPN-like nuclease [uncultured Rhodospira sp.]|uniref:MAE_28990/MAE_18760 family HEPN-like nuclease n=1 Tax=uncultured Rhodospira sp. TaxID=1936189 RepID=UPI00345B0F32